MVIKYQNVFSGLVFVLSLILALPALANGKSDSAPAHGRDNAKNQCPVPGPDPEVEAPAVGDIYGGGIVFYVDPDKRFGLVGALENVEVDGIGPGNGFGSVLPWLIGYDPVYATYDGPGAGFANSVIIVAAAKTNDT